MNSFTSTKRHGLSIMEVIFAIGVLMIGLLGIASVLPVATSDAKGALELDESLAKVENQIAVARSRVPDGDATVLVPNNRQNAANVYASSPMRLVFPNSNSDLGSPYAGNPNYAGVVCIDPWFLASADNRTPTSLMPDDRNGYDRTLFPCYQPQYDPRGLPNDPIGTTDIGTMYAAPRFARVAIDTNNGFAQPVNLNARETFRQRDGLPLFQPKDSTLPPGLLVRSAPTPTATHPLARSIRQISTTSRLSAITLMWPTAVNSHLYDVSVVVSESRNTLINPSAVDPLRRFNLEPYGSTVGVGDAVDQRIASQETYEDEILGRVTRAQLPLSAGGGEFTFQFAGSIRPRVARGDYMLLMRNQAPSTVVDTTSLPSTMAVIPKFGWVKIRDVITGPRLLPTAGVNSGPVFEVTVSVTGTDWVFHPCQIGARPVTASSAPGPMAPFGRGPDNLPPDGSQPYAYELADGFDEFATFVVVLPNVISVQQSQVSL
ncbi:type IV pilus modification PilV family protein [Rhodopirellula sp. P2]|uniref:type IV pilus modification PilV family protein n=1 Tax=Rhodopirellula sp. P2 TaxID=2127060 RepID=UPI0023683AB9|nr:hypothetical protein [Rhodopirellula sp. P2]WDQ16566.1 hypothetical protein PSR62_23540 [Rhodopirellula sp. P2]